LEEIEFFDVPHRQRQTAPESMPLREIVTILPVLGRLDANPADTAHPPRLR